MKRIEPLTHATTRMNLKNIKLNKRGQTQKTTYSYINIATLHLYETLEKRKHISDPWGQE